LGFMGFRVRHPPSLRWGHWARANPGVEGLCETVADIRYLYGRKAGRWDTYTGTSNGYSYLIPNKCYDTINHLPYYCIAYY
jgi:hypothetical protein